MCYIEEGNVILSRDFFFDQIFKNVWFRKDDVPYMYVSLTGFLKFKGVLYFFLSLLTSHKIYHIKNHFLYHPRMYTYIIFSLFHFFQYLGNNVLNFKLFESSFISGDTFSKI